MTQASDATNPGLDRRTAWIVLCAAAALAQEAADGANNDDEIVVTAQRREENLQTTPVAVTAAILLVIAYLAFQVFRPFLLDFTVAENLFIADPERKAASTRRARPRSLHDRYGRE